MPRTSRSILPILARVRATSRRSDATPYSIYNLLCETGYASAADYGALHGYLCNRIEGLDDDMLAARYGTPDEAPPALPEAEVVAATQAHERTAPRTRKATTTLEDAIPFIPRRTDTPFARRVKTYALTVADTSVGAYVAETALSQTEQREVDAVLAKAVA